MEAGHDKEERELELDHLETAHELESPDEELPDGFFSSYVQGRWSRLEAPTVSRLTDAVFSSLIDPDEERRTKTVLGLLARSSSAVSHLFLVLRLYDAPDMFLKEFLAHIQHSIMPMMSDVFGEPWVAWVDRCSETEQRRAADTIMRVILSHDSEYTISSYSELQEEVWAVHQLLMAEDGRPVTSEASFKRLIEERWLQYIQSKKEPDSLLGSLLATEDDGFVAFGAAMSDAEAEAYAKTGGTVGAYEPTMPPMTSASAPPSPASEGELARDTEPLEEFTDALELDDFTLHQIGGALPRSSSVWGWGGAPPASSTATYIPPAQSETPRSTPTQRIHHADMNAGVGVSERQTPKKPATQRWFERMLSNTAGRPGPVERLCARSQRLALRLQEMVGLRVVALLHACDSTLEFISEYIARVYGLWLMLRARKKKWQRVARGTLHTEMAQDAYLLRAQLSQWLALAGYASESHLGRRPNDELEEALDRETFPLEQVLALRGHLLAVKQDIKALPAVRLSTNIGAAVEGSMTAADVSWGQLVVGLIPNPFAFLSSWKDLLVMAFCMRYRRCDIEAIYADMVISTGRALRLSLAQQKREAGACEEVPSALMQWMTHEQDMIQRQGIKARDLHQLRDVREAAKRAEKSMQRLLQALCFPHRLMNYSRWRGNELLEELRKAPHVLRPGLVLAWEKWLVLEIQSVRNKHPEQPFLVEPEREYAESVERRQHEQNLEAFSRLG